MKINLKYNIDGREVKIAAPDCQTIFVNERNVKEIQIKEFEAAVKQVARECKKNKVKFSRKGARMVKENYSEYLREVAEYKKEFLLLQELARKIVEDGLTAPLIGNENLQAAYSVVNKLNRKMWASAVISRVHGVNQRVQEYLNKDLSKYSMISI